MIDLIRYAISDPVSLWFAAFGAVLIALKIPIFVSGGGS